MELSGREGWDYYDKAKGVRVRLVKTPMERPKRRMAAALVCALARD